MSVILSELTAYV